jgi:TonB family protein
MNRSKFQIAQRVGILTTAICLVLIGFITTCVAQTADEWRRYKVQGEEFSVALPALPAMRSREIYILSLRRNRVQRVLGSYANGVAYAIHAFENPEKESLDAFRERMKRYRRREWSAPETSVSVNNFVGKQFEFTERTVPGAAQFFATKKHLYLFEAVGAAADDPRVKQFFSSIILGSKTQGTELEDGIGAQPPVENPTDQDPSPDVTSRNVDRRVVIITKPEPSYTDAARRAQTTGTVVLKLVFASNGGVTNIRAVSELPNGLTEQSINAAKQIRFVPALKNGQFVSMWMQVEYNFNLY